MVGDGKCRWPLRRGWSTLELLLQRGKVDLGRALGDLAVADAPEGHAAEFEAPAGRLNCRAIGPCAATPDHTRCNGVASSDDVFGDGVQLAEGGMQRGECAITHMVKTQRA
jgi:hypothetical protein